MIKIYTPEDDIQLAMIKGIFESEGIHFYVHNDNFGSMRPGIRIDLYNKKAIMVHEKDIEKAQELLKNFFCNIEKAEPDREYGSSTYSFLDKCRMVVEALLFGWVMPGKRWEQKKKSKKAVQQPDQADGK